MPLDSLSPKQSSESTFSGAKIADELQLLEDADIQKFIVFPEQLPDEGIDGVEEKHLFSGEKLQQLFSEINTWFDAEKNNFPPTGIGIFGDLGDEALLDKSGFELPKAVKELITSVITDASESESITSNYVRVLLERTGSKNSEPDDMIYHVDSKQVYWDNQGKRTGYSEERGSDKYMIFIDRPGTYLIGYKIDPSLTHTEVSRDIATKYEIDSATGATTATVDATPKVYQLESDTVYKVEVGNILHAPRHMKTGFLSPYHYWMPYPFTQQSNSTVSVKKRKLASCLDLS